jgi:acyl-CoA thioester hydrolase
MPDDKPRPERSAFKAYRMITTRWMDNDVYAHVNNVIYYSFFDTAVNQLLVEAGLLDIGCSPVIGLVVETSCRYFAPLAFPDVVHAGVRVAHMGTSSVRYDIGLFRNDENLAAAHGSFVHVYVARDSRRPVPIETAMRAFLEPLRTDA